jgi:hypothetical protein
MKKKSQDMKKGFRRVLQIRITKSSIRAEICRPTTSTGGRSKTPAIAWVSCQHLHFAQTEDIG